MRALTLAERELHRKHKPEPKAETSSPLYIILASFAGVVLTGIFVFVHFIAKSW